MYKCLKCGQKFLTEADASRAWSGCPNCGGVDIDLVTSQSDEQLYWSTFEYLLHRYPLPKRSLGTRTGRPDEFRLLNEKDERGFIVFEHIASRSRVCLVPPPPGYPRGTTHWQLFVPHETRPFVWATFDAAAPAECTASQSGGSN